MLLRFVIVSLLLQHSHPVLNTIYIIYSVLRKHQAIWPSKITTITFHMTILPYILTQSHKPNELKFLHDLLGITKAVYLFVVVLYR